MLTRIKINGFKSFHNFDMYFTPFTVIAGANASGKSNLFDALRLLSALAESDNLKKAFKEQRGEFTELFTQYGEGQYANRIDFEVEMLVNKTVTDSWGGKEELKYTRLRYILKIKRFVNSIGIEDLAVIYEHLENLKHKDDEWIKIIAAEHINKWLPRVDSGKRGIPYMRTIEEQGVLTVEVPQDGGGSNKRRFPLKNASRTVLSSFDSIDFRHVLAAKEEMKRWKFLELNPEDLRQPSDKSLSEDELSKSGKNLAAVLYRIKQEDRYYLKEILRKFQTFLPNFIDLDVIDNVEKKQYIIKLKDKDHKEYSSRVLSEGTLRLLALCILTYDNKHTGLLCFEEPENGIHPFRIKDIAKLLKSLSTDFSDANFPLQQIIINTHSPTLVNCIYHWEHDNNVSIHYAEMRQRITLIDNKSIKISVTSISMALKSQKLSIPFDDSYQKLTINTLKQYLETTPSQH